ncbi:hypothetical protein SAMN05414139_02874 [Burkholderia sp. D7]|nr:hypothetical protein SAMN05414139_02874 [Burkholderia sp. D7]
MDAATNFFRFYYDVSRVTGTYCHPAGIIQRRATGHQ